jgi:hypothetical protein
MPVQILFVRLQHYKANKHQEAGETAGIAVRGKWEDAWLRI